MPFPDFYAKVKLFSDKQHAPELSEKVKQHRKAGALNKSHLNFFIIIQEAGQYIIANACARGFYMGSSPKIVVFKLREIIYTLILLFLVIVLVICLVLMFSKKSGENGHSQHMQEMSDTGTQQILTNESAAETQHNAESSGSQTGSRSDVTETASVEATQEAEQTTAAGGAYVSGVYTSSITLGDSAVDVEVTVSSNRIKAIRLVNLSEATAAAYPLVSSSLDNITAQILEKQKLDGITCSSENRYTSQLLLNAVSNALALAKNAN